MKITGGAGFSADAIEVFEGINGTLLLAAVSLVIFLLIVIYRSPMFFFIPLAAVLFAETLSRSIGYGVSELGVTINGQSSSIMSVLVLGAGTDYALLLVARYREELHRTADKYEAMRTALESAGPAIFASAADRDRRPALPDDRQGQRHRRPRPDRRDRHRLRGALDADPAAGAADDLRPPRLLALRPAHAGDGAGRTSWSPTGPARKIVDGSGAGALARVVLACLLVLILLPLVLLNWILRIAQRPPPALASSSARSTAPSSLPTRCAATGSSTPPTPPTASGHGSATGSRSRPAGSCSARSACC